MRSAILYALESPSSTLSPILGHSLSSSYWAGGGGLRSSGSFLCICTECFVLIVFLSQCFRPQIWQGQKRGCVFNQLS